MTREEQKQRDRDLLVTIACGVLLLIAGLALINSIAVENRLKQTNAVLAEHVTALENDKAALASRIIEAEAQRDEAQRKVRELEEQVADLSEQLELMTARWEDVAFGFDEVCYETGWPDWIGWNSIDECTVTAYCNCPKCCGSWSGGPTCSGAMPEQGVTVAVDTSVIPLGAQVMIEGDDTVYIAQDTGVHGAWIDKYYGSHADAVAWGLQHRTVYWRVV